MSKATTSIIEYIKANTAVAIIVGAGILAALAIAGTLAYGSNIKPVAETTQPKADNTKSSQTESKKDTAASEPQNAATGTGGDTAADTGDVAVAVNNDGGMNQTPVSNAVVQTAATTPQGNGTSGSTGSTGNNSGTTTPTDPTTPVTPVTPPTPPVTPPATGPNLIANGDVETNDGTNPTGWTNAIDTTDTQATFAYKTEGTNHYLNTNVTSIGTQQYPGAQWAPVAASAVTGSKSYKYTESYRATSNSSIDVEYTASGATQATYLANVATLGPSADWTTASGTFEVPANAVSVTVYHVLNTVGNLDTDNFSLTEYVPTPLSSAMVSLTFDDGWKSIYTNGLPLLQKYGFVSTQYLLTDPLIQNAADPTAMPDYMTIQDAQAFQAAGSEIASHTVHHCDLTGQQTDDPTNCPLPLSEAQINGELVDSRAYLEQAFGITVTDFASPYGGYNPQVITDIKAAGYTSHRGVEPGYNTADAYDPYDIKVQNICGQAVAGVCDHATTAADVAAWVANAQATKSWLVIVFHEVDANAEDASYAVTPANLDAMLAAIQQSGIAVKTVSQALAAMPPKQ